MLGGSQNRLSDPHKPPICFAVVKTYSLNESLMVSYTLCGSQKGLSDPLQASSTLCSNQNILSVLLQTSYTLCYGQNELSEIKHTQNILSELLQSSCMICDGQNEMSEPIQHPYVLFGSKSGLSKFLQAS